MSFESVAQLVSCARRSYCLFALLLALSLSLPSHAQDAQPAPTKDVAEMSLEQLLGTVVTSAAKRGEKLSDTAAAIFVISQEDIRRSGATSIPELLRMVPGLEVARITGSSWAVSSRGFNSQFSNKLLVLIDGRSVYDPLFSGVFWDAQDTMLEDIDRIEVIRGPGGTLWGANAVNGVINIITKKTKDTQGGLVVIGAGDSEKAFSSVRYGGKLGANTTYRLYSKYFARAPEVDAINTTEHDGWDAAHGGFRTDTQFNDRDSLTVEGDVYKGTAQSNAPLVTFTPPFTAEAITAGGFGGGDILGKFTRKYSSRSDASLQVYFDNTQQNVDLGRFRRNTIDVEFQHHFIANDRNEIVWGFGDRFTGDNTAPGIINFSFVPANSSTNTPDAFVQDDIQLVRGKLHFTLGIKLERDPISGLELQPSTSLIWTPSKKQSFWFSVARAVRTPSRYEAGLQGDAAALPGPGGLVAVVQFSGNTNVQAEDELGYQLGYRAQTSKHTSVDVATFYSRYTDYGSTELGQPFVEVAPTGPQLILPESPANNNEAKTFGAEFSGNWNPMTSWKLSGGYSWLNQALRPLSISNDTSTGSFYGATPKHQFNLRSSYNITPRLETDSSLFFVSRIQGLNGEKVAAYAEVNSRLAYRFTDAFEISLVGQNLVGARHAEAVTQSLAGQANQQKRSVYAKFEWRF